MLHGLQCRRKDQDRSQTILGCWKSASKSDKVSNTKGAGQLILGGSFRKAEVVFEKDPVEMKASGPTKLV